MPSLPPIRIPFNIPTPVHEINEPIAIPSSPGLIFMSLNWELGVHNITSSEPHVLNKVAHHIQGTSHSKNRLDPELNTENLILSVQLLNLVFSRRHIPLSHHHFITRGTLNSDTPYLPTTELGKLCQELYLNDAV